MFIKSVFFINYLVFNFFLLRIKKNLLMSDNFLEIDSAMNMIKEDIIRELSESVVKQNHKSTINDLSFENLSFSEKKLD